MRFFWIFVYSITLFIITHGTSSNFDSIYSSIRVYRDDSDDKLSVTVSQLDILSRIINGISLEIGLNSGSTPFDDGLREILQMGQIKPSDFMKLDQSIFHDFENLTIEMVSSKEVIYIEDRLMVFHDISESVEMDDLKNFTGKEEYKKQLDLVVGIEVKQKELTPIITLIPIFEGALASFDSWVFDIDDVDSAIYDLPSIKKKLTRMEKAAEPIKTALIGIQNAVELRRKSKFVKTLIAENNFKNKMRDKSSFDGKESLVENFKNIFELGEKSKTAFADIDNIRKLVKIRRVSNSSDNAVDLKQLDNDIQSDWFKESINNQKPVIDALIKSLNPLKSLMLPLENIEDYWSSLDDAENQTAVEKLILIQTELASLNNSFEAVSSSVDEFEKCQELISTFDSKFEDLQPAIQWIAELDEKLKEMEDFDNIDKLLDLTILKNIIDTKIEPGEDKTKYVKSISERIIAEPIYQKLRKLLKKLPTAHSKLTQLSKDVLSLIGNAKNAIKKFEIYHGYLTEDEFMEGYNCMKKAGEEQVSLRQIIGLARKIRVFGGGPEMSTAIGVMDTLVESQEAMKIVQGLMLDLEKVNTYELSTLKKSFPNFKDVSSTLDKAVQGLKSIGSGLESASDLEPLLDNVQSIVKSSKLIPLSDKLRESIGELNDLVDTMKGIEEFQKEVNGSRDVRIKRIPVISDFKSFGKVFELASKIPSFHVDHQTLKEALHALNQAFNHQYFDVMASLDTLQTLNLNFQSFEFKKSISALESLDNFFATFASSISNIPSNLTPPPSKPLIAHSKPTPSEWMMTSTEPNGYLFGFIPKFVWISCLVAVILSLIVAFIWCFFFRQKCCCCCKKVPNEELDLEQPSPIHESTVSTETTTVQSTSKIGKPKPGKSKLEKSKPAKSPKSRVASVKKDTTTESTTTTTTKAVVPSINKQQEEVAPQELEDEEDPTQRDEDFLQFSIKYVRAIRFKITENKLMPVDWAYTTHKAFENVDQQRLLDKLANSEERRFLEITCHPHTMAQILGFENPFVMASVVEIFERRCVVAQAPMDGTEIQCYLNKSEHVATGRPVLSTIEKHLAVICQYEVTIAVQLCPFEENGKKQCARYFLETAGDTLPCGRFSVKTTRVNRTLAQFKDSKSFVLYSLEINYSENGVAKTKALDVLFYSGWKKYSAPKTPEPALQILEFCNSYQGTHMFYSSAGTGRAGTLLAIKYGIELSVRGSANSLENIVMPIQDSHYGAIENFRQLMYLILTVTKGVMNARQMTYFREFDELQYYHEKFVDNAEHYRHPKAPKARYRESLLKTELLRVDAYCDRKFKEACPEEAAVKAKSVKNSSNKKCKASGSKEETKNGKGKEGRKVSRSAGSKVVQKRK